MPKLHLLKYFLLTAVACIALNSFGQAKLKAKEYYELKIYRVKDKSQETVVDNFLKGAYLPALHRAGIKHVGVFKPIETDSTFGKRIYVLVPHPSLDHFVKTDEQLLADKTHSAEGKEYLDALYTNPPYERIETILLRAFPGMTQMEVPALTNARNERVYELRSYESASEKIYRNKVKMFNDGDEIGLFKRLGFNAVFYADVIAGAHMPNLMYMTTFASMTSRDEHWKTFGNDPQWKNLIGMTEYQHNVSKANIYLLRPTEYSDY